MKIINIKKVFALVICTITILLATACGKTVNEIDGIEIQNNNDTINTTNNVTDSSATSLVITSTTEPTTTIPTTTMTTTTKPKPVLLTADEIAAIDAQLQGEWEYIFKLHGEMEFIFSENIRYIYLKMV